MKRTAPRHEKNYAIFLLTVPFFLDLSIIKIILFGVKKWFWVVFQWAKIYICLDEI